MLLVVVWRIITHLCCQHERDHDLILPADVEISNKIIFSNLFILKKNKTF